MPTIFISYRRSDTGHEAGRLRTSLVQHFGEPRIFRDKENIQPGALWPEEVRVALSGDTIVLALIGKTWLRATDDAGRRIIDSSESNNRLELEAAFRENLRVIPVLVEGAQVPKPNELPDALRELASRNALRLRDDDWDTDVRKIIETVEKPRRWLPWVAAAALVTLVAIAATVYTIKPQPDPVVPAPEPKPIPVSEGPNFQIVIDRSEIMNTSFGEGTRLDAAKKALVSVLQEKTADTDNLSLREFGGKCSDLNATRLVLPFAPGESRLAQAVNGLTTTAGTSTIVDAIIEATGDFSGLRGSSGLIIIAGSYNACKHPDPDTLIQQRLKLYPGLTLDLRYIGVALTRREQSMASELARKTGGTFRNATTPAQLGEAVEHAMVVQAKVSEVQVAVEILGECMNHLNTAVIKHLGSQFDYTAADREVGEAEKALKRTVVLSPEAQQPEGVRRLLDIARQARDDQQRMLEATMALIAAKKSGDANAESRARGAYNSAAIAYNGRTEQIDSLREELLAK